MRKWMRSAIHIFLIAALLGASGAFFWTYSIHRFMLPMKKGQAGQFGIIERPTLFIPGTKILTFNAQYVPSRIVWTRIWEKFERFEVPIPVPESLHVTIQYQQPGKAVQAWDHTYLFACDVDAPRRCVALYELIGLMVYGKGVDADGKGESYGYLYLRGQIIPHPSATPLKPSPTPSPTPSRTPALRPLPDGVEIAGALPVHNGQGLSFV